MLFDVICFHRLSMMFVRFSLTLTSVHRISFMFTDLNWFSNCYMICVFYSPGFVIDSYRCSSTFLDAHRFHQLYLGALYGSRACRAHALFRRGCYLGVGGWPPCVAARGGLWHPSAYPLRTDCHRCGLEFRCVEPGEKTGSEDVDEDDDEDGDWNEFSHAQALRRSWRI